MNSLTEIATEYLNFLVWDIKYNVGHIKKSFQEIIDDDYKGNVDDAITNFFLCEFNNTNYYFFEWIEKQQYNLNTTQINIAYLILKDIVINRSLDELKEIIFLAEICIK